jgi:hypothetical protein
MISTCSFYQYSPLTSSLAPTHTLSANEAVPVPLERPSTPTGSDSIDTDSVQQDVVSSASKVSDTGKTKGQRRGPSSCWIDLTHPAPALGSGRSRLKLGRWSAPTWRRYPSVLSQSTFNNEEEALTNPSHSSIFSTWRHFLQEGIFVGFDDVGFRLKLSMS